MSDPVHQYFWSVGRVIAHLHSLEFALRAYLYGKKDAPHADLAAGQTLDSLRVGDTLPENAMTDYSSLDKLIKRYNRLVEKGHPELELDPSLVELRDAFAHGRSSTVDFTKPNFLLKFDPPAGGKIKVCFAESLTFDWLNTQAERVAAELTKVVKALKLLGLA